jgi:hypothetical protein
MQQVDPTIKVGARVYNAADWVRRDEIFVGGRKIGIIKLTSRDRKGRTISLVTNRTRTGRAIAWCVEESNILLA